MSPDIQELKRLAEAAKKVTLQSPDDRALYDFDRATTPDTILALIEIAEAAQELVSAVDDLISESHGVYGLHQNGDIAPWNTLTEGGQFEDWLLPLSVARAALKEITDV